MIFTLHPNLHRRDQLLLRLRQLCLQFLQILVTAIDDLATHFRLLTLQSQHFGATHVTRGQQWLIHLEFFADQRMHLLERVQLCEQRTATLFVERGLIGDEVRVRLERRIELQRPVIELRLDSRERRAQRCFLAATLIDTRLRLDAVEAHEQLPSTHAVAFSDEQIRNDTAVCTLHDLHSAARNDLAAGPADLIELGPVRPGHEADQRQERNANHQTWPGVGS